MLVLLSLRGRDLAEGVIGDILHLHSASHGFTVHGDRRDILQARHRSIQLPPEVVERGLDRLAREAVLD